MKQKLKQISLSLIKGIVQLWTHLLGNMKRMLPLVALGGLAVLLVLFTQIFGVAPNISTIKPKIGLPGETMEISGAFFGNTAGKVVISGQVLNQSAVREWNDSRIVLAIPEEVRSGMVHVVTERGKSRGLFFTNRNDIPRAASGTWVSGRPSIEKIEPPTAYVGGEIAVYGRNFGSQRSGVVDFTWAGPVDPTGEPELVHASDRDADYISWSDTLIRLRIPDGAGSGPASVLTAKGRSNPIYLTVEAVDKPQFTEPRRVVLEQRVAVWEIESDGPNEAVIHIPSPVEDARQRQYAILSENPPAWTQFFELPSQAKLSNRDAGSSFLLRRTFSLVVYQQNHDISRLARIQTPVDQAILARFGRHETDYPSDAPAIHELVKDIAAPGMVERARMIYLMLLEKMTFGYEHPDQDPITAIQKGQAGMRGYVSALISLYRASGIPARPVMGILQFGDGKAIRHIWCEFFVPGCGWLPVDPVLADAPYLFDFQPPQDRVWFYFGNIDNRHIAFSRGVIEVPSALPGSHPSVPPEIYSLQDRYEEMTGIARWKSSWRLPQIPESP